MNFQNRALKQIVILLFAYAINDLFTYPTALGVPITPVQIALLVGIFNLSILNQKAPSFVVQIRRYLFIYYSIVVFSTIFVFVNYGYTDISFITIGINILWFSLLVSPLSQGISAKDIKKFVKSIVFIVGFITIPAGLYELITQKNILTTEAGLIEKLFYIRGFHIDKVDFGYMLIIGALISFSAMIKNVGNIFVNFFIFIGSGSVILFTYSLTSILALGSALIITLLINIKRATLLMPIFIILIFIFQQIGFFGQLIDVQKEAYQLKYTVEVDHKEERSFRYMSYINAPKAIWEKPFLGYGVGRSGYVLKELINTRKVINGHSIFINELIDYGIIGFLPLLFFWSALGRLVVELITQSKKYSSELQLLSLFTLSFGIALLIRFILYYHRMDHLLYFVEAGFIIAAYGTYKKQKSANESSYLR